MSPAKHSSWSWRKWRYSLVMGTLKERLGLLETQNTANCTLHTAHCTLTETGCSNIKGLKRFMKYFTHSYISHFSSLPWGDLGLLWRKIFHLDLVSSFEAVVVKDSPSLLFSFNPKCQQSLQSEGIWNSFP